jgi:hypothetical protein
VRASAKRDASQRVVITGIGAATVFGNDVDTFYNRCVRTKCGRARARPRAPLTPR